MSRLLLAALVLAIAAALLSMAARLFARSVRAAGSPRGGLAILGDTPMQRLSFVLLVALVFYAAIWGAG